MSCYFFDIHDGSAFWRDTEGTECDGSEAVRLAAMRALPDIAKDRIPKAGDQQSFTILARDEDNRTVYAATLTFSGLCVGELPIPERKHLDG